MQRLCPRFCKKQWCSLQYAHSSQTNGVLEEKEVVVMVTSFSMAPFLILQLLHQLLLLTVVSGIKLLECTNASSELLDVVHHLFTLALIIPNAHSINLCTSLFSSSPCPRPTSSSILLNATHLQKYISSTKTKP